VKENWRRASARATKKKMKLAWKHDEKKWKHHRQAGTRQWHCMTPQRHQRKRPPVIPGNRYKECGCRVSRTPGWRWRQQHETELDEDKWYTGSEKTVGHVLRMIIKTCISIINVIKYCFCFHSNGSFHNFYILLYSKGQVYSKAKSQKVPKYTGWAKKTGPFLKSVRLLYIVT